MLRPDCTCVQAGLSMHSSYIDGIVFFPNEADGSITRKISYANGDDWQENI